MVTRLESDGVGKLTGEGGALVKLPGNFDIVQVFPSAGRLLLHHLGQYDIPDYGILIDNISTERAVTGKTVSFSGYFLELGTSTYDTIRGGTNTVYHVEALSDTMLAWARSEIETQKAEELRRRKEAAYATWQTAKAEAEQLASDLATLVEANRRVDRYIEATSKLKMYAAARDKRDIALLIANLEIELAQIGPVDETTVNSYREKRDELAAKAGQARVTAAQLRQAYEMLK
ncbi:MAG: hypothetical protein WD042_16300 [Phycisphaeraceae bacterium]